MSYSVGLTSGSGVRSNQIYTSQPYATSGATYTTTGAPYGTTTYVSGPTTSTYVAGPTQTYTTGLATQSYPVATGYTTTGYVGGVSSGYGTSTVGQKVVAEQIPVESRIEYIPFQKKYIEYDRVQRIERVPFERQIVEYEEVVHNQRIPVERTITDYYAVQTQIEYIPKEIQETIVEYEPVQKTWQRVQYLPVQTQIIHYPERQRYVAGQGKFIQADRTATTNQVYQTNYQTVQTVPSATYQTYQTNTIPTTSTYQTYQTQSIPTTTTYQTQSIPTAATYQTQGYSSNVYGGHVGQAFVSGAHGTGSNYVYTSGGPLETSTYTTAGYAQPLSSAGYVTKDGTHLTSTGHIISSGSQVKGNQSYQTNV